MIKAFCLALFFVSLRPAPSAARPLHEVPSFVTHELGGLLLALPKNLHTTLQREALAEGHLLLHGGSFDAVWLQKDGDQFVPQRAWIELQAQSYACDPVEWLQSFRRRAARRSSKPYHIQLRALAYPDFKGFRLVETRLLGDDADSLTYVLINSESRRCFQINLALLDFHGANPLQIQGAIKPMTDAIEASLQAHIHRGNR